MSELEVMIRQIIDLAQDGLNKTDEYGSDSHPLRNALFNVQAWAKDALSITVTADIANSHGRKSFQYGYSNLFKQNRTDDN